MKLHQSSLLIFVMVLSLLIIGCKKEETSSPANSLPKSMTINKIEVIRYQELNNGNSWDAGSGPDLKIQIAKDNNIVWTSLTFIEDPIFGNVQSFNMQPPYAFDSPSSEYTLSLFDEDSPTVKEFMGAITFTPYGGGNNPPTILNLDDGGDVAFKIYVSYNY